jgi:hypothetical protein
MRVLHLLDTFDFIPSPVQLAQVADVLRADAADEQAVWTIGTAEIAPCCAAVGLRVQRHIPCGPGRWRQWLARRRFPAALPADRVHLWTIGAAALVPPTARVTASFLHLPAEARIASAARRAIARAAALGAFHDADARAVESALPGPRVVERLDPGVDPRRLAAVDRAAFFESIGLEDPTLRLAAVIADRPEDVDAMVGVMGVGLADESGRKLRCLISPAARGLDRAMHVLRAARRRHLLIAHPIADEPWRWLGACDLAVVSAGTIAAAWAMAAGVPVVAADRPDARRVVELGVTARLERADSIAPMAMAVCRAVDEAESTAAMAAAARAVAVNRFSASRLAAVLRGRRG